MHPYDRYVSINYSCCPCWRLCVRSRYHELSSDRPLPLRRRSRRSPQVRTYGGSVRVRTDSLERLEQQAAQGKRAVDNPYSFL